MLDAATPPPPPITSQMVYAPPWTPPQQQRTCSLSSTSALKSPLAATKRRNLRRSAFCTLSFWVATNDSSMILQAG